MSKITLDQALKSIGAVPMIHSPKAEPTQFSREIDKLKYRIGVIAYKQGQEYLVEPIQWNIIKEGILKKIY